MKVAKQVKSAVEHAPQTVQAGRDRAAKVGAKVRRWACGLCVFVGVK